MDENIIASFPYGRWVEESENTYVFIDNYGNIVYRSHDIVLLGISGFVIPFNIGGYDYKENAVKIEYGESNGNSCLVHYKSGTMCLVGTKFNEISFSDNDFLIYPKDNGLSFGLAVYDDTTEALKEGYYVSDYLELLSDRHLLSKKNDVYYLISCVKTASVTNLVVEPIGMVPFKISECGNYLVTHNNEIIKEILKK